MNEKGGFRVYYYSMFSLEMERGKFVRLRGNADRGTVERLYSCPVNSDVYDGAIVCLTAVRGYCFALVGDDYEKIALREGVDLTELKKVNADLPVYPTRKIWLPK